LRLSQKALDAALAKGMGALTYDARGMLGFVIIKETYWALKMHSGRGFAECLAF